MLDGAVFICREYQGYNTQRIYQIYILMLIRKILTIRILFLTIRIYVLNVVTFRNRLRARVRILYCYKLFYPTLPTLPTLTASVGSVGSVGCFFVSQIAA